MPCQYTYTLITHSSPGFPAAFPKFGRKKQFFLVAFAVILLHVIAKNYFDIADALLQNIK
jgi:hypothetical protein